MHLVIFGSSARHRREHRLAKYSIFDNGVSIMSGRGANRVSLFVDFKALINWAKKVKVDTVKLMKRSFGRACSGLKKKFIQVVQSSGGVCGVPKFKDFESFTNELRTVKGISNRPMGGRLAEKSSVVAYKRNGWQIIGWHDSLMDTALKFQDAFGGAYAEGKLNNNNFRRYLHIKGI